MANGKPVLTVRRQKEIICHICQHFKVKEADLFGKRRFQKLAHARQTLMYILHSWGWSYPMIGGRLNRDHTTVLHGVEMVAKRLSSDAALAELVDLLAWNEGMGMQE